MIRPEENKLAFDPATKAGLELQKYYVNVKEFGAKGDGVTDDTTAFQNAVNYAASSKLYNVLVPDGTFMINPNGTNGYTQGVQLLSGINFVMQPNTVLKALSNTTGVSAVLSAVKVENVSISGGTIIGERATHVGTLKEHGMGINILHSKRVTVSNVEIKDCWGDCIYIGGKNFGVTADYSPYDIKVINCKLSGSRRQGISVTMSDGVLISNCDISNISGVPPSYGIDIETNDPTNPCLNVRVEKCRFYGSVGGLVVGNTAKNISVTGCYFLGNELGINSASNTTVSENAFVGTRVSVRKSVGTVIQGNTFESSNVTLYANNDVANGVIISKNSFINADGDVARHAIEVTGTDNAFSNVQIKDNVFDGYVTETIYLFARLLNSDVSGNLIRVTSVTRWVAILRGYDMKISGNNIIVDLATAATINNVISMHLLRGSFDSNNIQIKNATLAESAISCGSIATETVGCTILNNRVGTTQSVPALKFDSSSVTKYSVMFNDFRFASSIAINPTGNFFYNNVISTTASN